jgi:hypothetical protein
VPHLRFNLCLIALLAFSVHATENRGETRDAFWPTSELAVRYLTDRPVKRELDESPSKQSHGFLPLLKLDYPSVNFASNRDRAPADPLSWALRDAAFWVDLYDPTAVGLAVSWEKEPWRVISEAYLVRTHRNSIQPGGNNSLFGASLQAEYHAPDDWALYGRIEKIIGDKDEVEVPFLPHFVNQLLLGGINYRLGRNHSLKLEIAGNGIGHGAFGEVLLQWSTVFE